MEESRVIVEFSCENAAFEESKAIEAADTLRRVADRIARGETGGAILDVNGNTIGRFRVR